MARPAHALQRARDRARAADLHDQVHLAHVDPQLHGGGRAQQAQLPLAQLLLGLQALLPGDAAVVRARKARPGELVYAVGQALGLLAALYKGQHRARALAELVGAPAEVRPNRALHKAQVRQGRGDQDVRLLAQGGRDDGARRGVRQELRRALQRPDRGREPDALHAPAAEVVQPRQREHQVRPALGADQGVQLVHDHGLDRAQHGPAARRGQQQVERLRRGQQDVRGLAQHLGAVRGRRVARAQARA